MRSDLWIRWLFLVVSISACKQEKKIEFVPVSKDAGPERIQVGDPNVKPVYPADTKPSPLAERLCKAMQSHPIERREQCCKVRAGVMLTAECVRNLSGALAAGAVTLAEEDVARCEAAMIKRYEGCDWVGGLPEETPAECLGIIKGTIKTGEVCRSSLECGEGMRCLGSGPTDPGKCGEPLAEGRLCNTAVDALAAYTRQDDFETRHPACKGYCDRNRCYDAKPIGGECLVNPHCGRGNRCKGGRCIAGAFANEGEVCLGGDCAPGLRCSGKKCVAPKNIGESCNTDFDCKAACVLGKCALDCSGLPAVLRPKTSTASQPQ